jgi:hypothetical protein
MRGSHGSDNLHRRDGFTQPKLPARYRHRHLIEMPPRRWPWTSMAKFSGEQRPELQNPSPYRFRRDIQTALREQIFTSR